MFFTILTFGFILKVLPLLNNNFYFTIDQGNDAVHARQIFEGGKLLFKGPETGIPGIFAGPGWYYFISIGYKLFGGHPIGAILVVIIFNLLGVGLLSYWISKRISPELSLIVAASLSVFWPMHDATRWAFNPFPLVPLVLTEVALLASFLATGKKLYYFAALIPSVASFNFEVAGAAALYFFFFLVGVALLSKKVLSSKEFFILNILLPITFTAGSIKNFLEVFLQTRILSPEVHTIGTFSQPSLLSMAEVFTEKIASATVPQNIPLSILIFISVVFYFFKSSKNKFARSFVVLSLTLFFISYLFFSASRGFRDWHIVYLSPLLFTAFLIMLTGLEKRLGATVFSLVLVSQLALFTNRFLEYRHSGNDYGLLTNQLTVTDYIYNEARNKGFSVYTYSPHVFDYQYQYLFAWYGRKKYGFLPCDYSFLPARFGQKHQYISDYLSYSQPTLGCGDQSFLILEPGNVKDQATWRALVAPSGTLTKVTSIAGLTVEKWQITP